ncbi:hypothetical protein LAZ67_7000565 [Cordylochernes scorpioides]|uniref:Uncharacterized protein n=1 Tax=Cordylochernes scorpioides TaxID=51811 RepID=A0ABY6KLK0_9ARAC|nr:hypothetical protein LAZ67_7000565 [Cordylochernes scorpioides]
MHLVISISDRFFLSATPFWADQKKANKYKLKGQILGWYLDVAREASCHVIVTLERREQWTPPICISTLRCIMIFNNGRETQDFLHGEIVTTMDSGVHGRLNRVDEQLVKLVDGVCWGRVELINGRVNTVNNICFYDSLEKDTVLRINVLQVLESKSEDEELTLADGHLVRWQIRATPCGVASANG